MWFATEAEKNRSVSEANYSEIGKMSCFKQLLRSMSYLNDKIFDFNETDKKKKSLALVFCKPRQEVLLEVIMQLLKNRLIVIRKYSLHNFIEYL